MGNLEKEGPSFEVESWKKLKMWLQLSKFVGRAQLHNTNRQNRGVKEATPQSSTGPSVTCFTLLGRESRRCQVPRRMSAPGCWES